MSTFSASSLPALPPSAFHISLQWLPAFLGLEGFRTDLHLHSFERVVGSMPAVPADAIHVLPVLPLAVVHPIEVGVCTAVVPVATW